MVLFHFFQKWLMTHLVVSEGTLWVIKCGHKFIQNANRTFFSLSIITSGTCLSPQLATHFKPCAEWCSWHQLNFWNTVVSFGMLREADTKAGWDMQEISWGKHLKTKTEVPEKVGRGFSWQCEPDTSDRRLGGKEDGVKEPQSVASSEKCQPGQRRI